MQGHWTSEFDESFAVQEEITAKLPDLSWHNDTCPSFHIADSAKLFVDHPDEQRREVTLGKRFTVYLYDERGEGLGTAIETDRLPELLAYLKDHWNL